jgi:uncharacterized protein YgiM (DUF1202 family)
MGIMINRKTLHVFSAALFLVALSGCVDVKTLPPINEEIAAEQSAVLIIPATATVRRIDGEKRKGFVKVWWVGYFNRGEKAALLPVPAGEHTIVFDYANPKAGLSAQKLECTAEMSAGKMYIVSAGLEESAERGTLLTAVNGAASVIKKQAIAIIPFIELLPSSNPKGLVYGMNEIDQAAFDQYILEEKSLKGLFLIILVGLLWLVIIVALRALVHRLFMGKLVGKYPLVMLILCGVMLVAAVLIINYNSGGDLSLYLFATLLTSIAISAWGSGGNDNGSAARGGSPIKTILIIIGVIGLAFGVYVFVGSLSKPENTEAPAAIETITATVTAGTANFRSAPSTSSAIIKTLQKGDTLTVTGSTENGWVPVKHGDDTGYVSADLLFIPEG